MMQTNADMPLYPTEAQIARKVLGPNRLDEWKALAIILERKGLPAIDDQFGGRYWPAVELWFQAHNRLVSIAPGRFGKQDGGETCPEPKRPPASSGGRGGTVHEPHTGSREKTS
jgi:hypothetical protein